MVTLLLAEREKHLRIFASVPDCAAADLSLIKLPEVRLYSRTRPNPEKASRFRSCGTPTTSRRSARESVGLLVSPICDRSKTYGAPMKQCSWIAGCCARSRGPLWARSGG